MFLSQRRKEHHEQDIRTSQGFAELYETHLDFVYSLSYYYLKDKSESEDITSKIFVSLWERREELYQDTWERDSWKRYLARAVKLSVLKHIRNKKRAEAYLLTTAKASEVDHSTQDQLSFGELKGQVQLLVEELPPKCKQVFQLSREKGLSNKEIAQYLSITDHAVKKHIAKALSYLRERLTDYTIPKRATGT
ncbi:MAG: RNA polymerase sigma-70 factor [Bacteroidota bacterium]